ncbi:sugar-transfer associated ATP-grasp domain-containing protein [Butyrivibrio sp. TB]|uniref:sugar-transfer associated ATP-grasp domain-containing protein n=1 Tax=Butyrivibrio sp. TB TaxID=1520809 RepID=UPI0008D52096|nr:sugar-transfer associated ATP-grasp domain-containing protein [Butyrivibrio sp. TB]SEP83430.1 Leucine rich repeat-containing protein [Butyrivibrio sp. TB]
MGLSNYVYFHKQIEKYLKEREDDVIRVANAKKALHEIESNSEIILRWLQNNTGTLEAPQLSENEVELVKNAWKDIWELGIVNPEWHRIYKHVTGVFDPAFIPSDIHFQYVENKTIDYAYLRGYIDKNYIDILFPDVKHPTCLIRKIHGIYLDYAFRRIDLDSAINQIFEKRIEGVVIKISVFSEGGKGVFFVDETTGKNDIKIALEKSADIHVEKVIRQHPEMEKMNPTSVNTIRIMTMLINGDAIPLSAIVRIGNKGSRVDNFSSGGYSCGIQPDGKLKEYGYTQKGQRLLIHPNGFKFSEGKIPNFEYILATVKRLHYHVPMFGVISWDISIDTSGEPVLIEYNVGRGGVDFHQYNNGPLYGKYRETIIKNTFDNYAKNDAILDYSFSVTPKGVIITKISQCLRKVNIPAFINKKQVKVIGAKASFKQNKCESIIIDACLDEIQDCAFMNCNNLRKVKIKGDVRNIGRSSFNQCKKLEIVQLPKNGGVEVIAENAFRDCVELKKIIIPKSVVAIGDEAFLNCYKLTIITPVGSYAEQYSIEHNINFVNC